MNLEPKNDGGDWLQTPWKLTRKESLTEDEWEQIGAKFANQPWNIGDWLLYAEAKWGERYKRAAEITGYSEGTLRVYASVSRRFDLLKRFNNLTFFHHSLVAAIPEQAAEQWLTLASSERWTGRELQRALKSVQQLPPGEPNVVVTVFKITVPNEHEQRWRDAAEQRGLDVEEWIVAVADEASG